MRVFIELNVPIDGEIKEKRGDRSYRDIAKASGADHNNLFRILNGKQGTTIETLRLLGDALDIDVDRYVREALRGVGL